MASEPSFAERSRHMERWEEHWKTLSERRRAGERHPLRVLVLGPSDDGSAEREIRCAVRVELSTLGHSAVFPEDLCEQEDAWKDDVLSDIVLQAKEADVIIMIYRTRGTQSERDLLLNGLFDNPEFAHKAIVFISKQMFETVRRSLTGQDWLRGVAEVHPYEAGDVHEPMDRILNIVRERTHQLRRLAYVRGLLKGTIC
jgi:hypothetical protein